MVIDGSVPVNIYLPLHHCKWLRKMDVLKCYRYIFLKVLQILDVIGENKSETLAVSSQRAETWRLGRKKWHIFKGCLAVMTWFLNISQSVRFSINRMQEDAFLPNLVEIGRGSAEKKYREKKVIIKQTDRKTILTKFWKFVFLHKRQYNNCTYSYTCFRSRNAWQWSIRGLWSGSDWPSSISLAF